MVPNQLLVAILAEERQKLLTRVTLGTTAVTAGGHCVETHQ
jgi:hypothetical protein